MSWLEIRLRLFEVTCGFFVVQLKILSEEPERLLLRLLQLLRLDFRSLTPLVFSTMVALVLNASWLFPLDENTSSSLDSISDVTDFFEEGPFSVDEFFLFVFVFSLASR